MLSIIIVVIICLFLLFLESFEKVTKQSNVGQGARLKENNNLFQVHSRCNTVWFILTRNHYHDIASLPCPIRCFNVFFAYFDANLRNTHKNNEMIVLGLLLLGFLAGYCFDTGRYWKRHHRRIACIYCLDLSFSLSRLFSYILFVYDCKYGQKLLVKVGLVYAMLFDSVSDNMKGRGRESGNETEYIGRACVQILFSFQCFGHFCWFGHVLTCMSGCPGVCASCRNRRIKPVSISFWSVVTTWWPFSNQHISF